MSRKVLAFGLGQGKCREKDRFFDHIGKYLV